MSIPVILVLGGGNSLSSSPAGSSNFQAIINSNASLDSAIASLTGNWLVDGSFTLDADKTIPANVTLEFRNNAKIIGAGFTITLDSTYIEAPTDIQIFQNIKFLGLFSNNIFYADWIITYINKDTDVQPEAQQAIDLGIYNMQSSHVVFSAKEYALNFPLLIARTSDMGIPEDGVNTYQFVEMKIEGAKRKYKEHFGTTFKALFKDKFILGLQAGRNVEINDITCFGAGAYSMTVDKLIDGTYEDLTLRDSKYSPYAGVVIDPFTSTVPPDGGYPGMTQYYTSNVGSSVTRLNNVKVWQMVVAYMLTPNGESLINDSVSIVNCEVSRVKTSVSIGQSQDRNISITNLHILYTHTAIDCNVYGDGNASAPLINGLLIAGGCYRLFNCPTNNFGGSANISGIYAESTWTIGTVVGKQSIAFTGCTIKLVDYEARTYHPGRHLICSYHMSFTGSYLGFYTGSSRRLNVEIEGNDAVFTLYSCGLDDYPTVFKNARFEFPVFISCRNIYGNTLEPLQSEFFVKTEKDYRGESYSISRIIDRKYQKQIIYNLFTPTEDLTINGDGTGNINTIVPSEYSSRIGQLVYDSFWVPIGIIGSVLANDVTLTNCRIDAVSDPSISIATYDGINEELVDVTGRSNQNPEDRTEDNLIGSELLRYTKSDAVIGYKCTSSGTPGTWKNMYEDLSASQSLDFGSIGAGSQADLTILVAGVTIADWIASGNPQTVLEVGLVAQVFVSALDTITVRLVNITVGAIDPAANVWDVIGKHK